MKKILKLQDHKHTARRLEHEHTSYRALVLLMIIFGISLFFVQRTVNADSYVVSASVQAPIPTIPAVITIPANQATVNTANIIVSGTCPVIVPAIVVEIFRNDEFIGSAGCSASGDFSGTFSLRYGTNVLIPKIITITNDYGPVGLPVSVIYPAPPQIQPQQSTPNKQTDASKPDVAAQMPEALQISSTAPFLVFKENESFVWKVDVKGGVSPYTILVDWGDGTKSTYAANSAGEQKLEHVFQKNNNTIVRISVRDATGKEVFTTVAGVTFKQPSLLVNGAAAMTTGDTLSIGSLWIGYGTLLLIIIFFWLGTKTHRRYLTVPPTKKRAAAHNKRK